MLQYMNIGEKYAKALFESLSGDKTSVVDQLNALSELSKHDETASTLRDPAISESDKINAIQFIIKERSYNTSLSALFALLIKNKRIDAVPAVASLFERYVREENNISLVIAEFAAKPDKETTKQITTALENALGNNVELEQRIKPDIIGGLRIYINSVLYDYSVDARLKNLASYCKKHSFITTKIA